MEGDDQVQEDKRRWHLGKEVPVATVMIMAVQTVAVIWWAASISAKVESMDKAMLVIQIAQTARDQRQDEDAARSEARITQQLDKINQKIDRLIEARMR